MTSEALTPPKRKIKDDSTQASAQTTEEVAALPPQVPAQNLELTTNSDMRAQHHPVSSHEEFPGAVMDLKPSTSAAGGDTSDAPSITDDILKSTTDTVGAPEIGTSNTRENYAHLAPESNRDQQRLMDQDRNKIESDEFETGSVASTAVHPSSAKLEDAGQEPSDANTDVTEAVIDQSQPNTASALAIDQDDMFANFSEDDLEKNMKDLIQEEDMLQCRESESYWTPQDAERLQSVRERMQQLDEVLRKRTLPQAKEAVKCFGHNQLPKSSTSVKKTKQANDPKKRKLDEAKNDSPVAKKPRTHKKPTKGQIKAVDFVTKSMFNQMTGGSEDSFDADAVKNLEPISKAPAGIREHLKAIQAAGLRLPHAKPEIVKAHAKALGGISQAFRAIVSPWVADGDDEKTVEDFKWKIAGMHHPLHHHQLVAAANMSTIEKDDENDSTTKFGLRSGLLYDHMGYGKTPETLACIVSNPPRGKRTKNGSSTTLVVVPKSAAKQWAEEVKNHCAHLKATLYNKDLDTTRSDRQHVLSTDILVVTYDELRSAHRRVEKKKIEKSLLFESKFYRVVVDESHRLKNPCSEIFKVCLKLKSKHKWCLSGTPIQNGVFEIYAPLKFLGHPLVGEFSDFKEKYLGGWGGKNLPTEGSRYSELGRILDPIMILRSPNHRFLCRPLVSLPENHATLVNVELSREEEVIQEYVNTHIGAYLEKKAAEKPTKKPGRRGKGKTQTADEPSEEYTVRSLNEVLLRMRQAVASPALLENLVKGGIWTLDQIKSMKHDVQKNGNADTPFIDLFEKWIKEPKLPKLSSAGRKAVAEVAMVEAAKCTACRKILSEDREPQESECGCRYCKICIEYTIGFLRFSKKHEEPRCPPCSGEIGAYRPCSLLPMDDVGSQKTKASRERMRGDDYNNFQPQDASGSTLMRIVDASSAVPQSSKMKAALKQIQDWHEEAKDDKMIVFSSFIGASRLLGRVLQDNGIEFLYFIGEMDDEQRQRAISAFKTVSDIKVLIMSMKCGSESLNLTAGNRIIILDIWWNRSSEQQAIARVYRIGQAKVTHAARILAKDTIDDKIYKLQEEKLDQMEGSLQEFHVEKGLGARALRGLLGDRWKAKGDDNYGPDDETDFEFVVKDDDSEDGDYED